MTGRESVVCPGGECCLCRRHAPERIVVRIIEQGSGPGASAFACPPCARAEAAKPHAPGWLRANVTALDAPPPRHLRAVE